MPPERCRADVAICWRTVWLRVTVDRKAGRVAAVKLGSVAESECGWDRKGQWCGGTAHCQSVCNVRQCSCKPRPDA